MVVIVVVVIVVGGVIVVVWLLLLLLLCDQCLMLVSCICRHKLKCEEELSEKRRYLELKEKQLQS